MILQVAAMAQNDEMENTLEILADESNQTVLDILDQLDILKEEKIKVNSCSIEDLEKIPFLNIFQIHNLLSYRRNTGFIATKYELNNIKGFNKKLIETIAPYLDFSRSKNLVALNFHQPFKYSRSQVLLRHRSILQTKKGYTSSDDSYLGIPHSFYLRYKGKLNSYINTAFVLEQDAGEPFKTDSQKLGIDHFSGNITVTKIGSLNKLIFGDFQAQVGQGLSLWTGYGIGKTANVLGTKKNSDVIIPFSGLEENRYLRGVASEWQFGSFKLNAFYSNKNVDANLLETDSLNDNLNFSTLQSSGLHRTTSEIEDRKSVNMQLVNTTLTYFGNTYKLGVSLHKYLLNTPLKESNKLYQKFQFNGSQLSQASIFGNYFFCDLNIFLESAVSKIKHPSLIIGAELKPDDRLKCAILYRYVPQDYQTIYSSPFRENSNGGERGVYLAFEWFLNSKFLWKNYSDLFYFDWPTFANRTPGEGLELVSEIQYIGEKSLLAYVRFKHENKETTSSNEQNNFTSEYLKKQSLRFNLRFDTDLGVRLTQRVELSKNSLSSKNGILLHQDLQYKFSNSPLSLKSRFTIFDIGDFSNRIYSYENDISYSFSVPVFNGQGSRFYILLDWEISKSTTLQIKWATTQYSDREEIGTGLNTINGNRISEIKTQLKFKF